MVPAGEQEFCAAGDRTEFSDDQAVTVDRIVIRFHDLRHTFATLALQNGVDVKTVSSMLGHFDAGFTLRTYTHVTRQMQESAAEKMGNFMAQMM